MKVSHLDHLNLTVKNIDESAEWYHKLFGFSQVEGGTRGGVRWSILRSGDAMLCIYEHPELADPDEHEGQSHKIYHFGLRITDREKFEKLVKLHKVPLAYGGAIRYPHSWSWYVTDPTGYEIEVALWDEDRIRFDH
jgi:catechol-2,3-dioxygenase